MTTERGDRLLEGGEIDGLGRHRRAQRRLQPPLPRRLIALAAARPPLTVRPPSRPDAPAAAAAASAIQALVVALRHRRAAQLREVAQRAPVGGAARGGRARGEQQSERLGVTAADGACDAALLIVGWSTRLRLEEGASPAAGRGRRRSSGLAVRVDAFMSNDSCEIDV